VRSYLHFLAITFAISVHGCVGLFSEDPSGVLIERSKVDAPDWIKVDGLGRTSDEFRFNFRRDDNLNLPLGISQTQAGAKQNSEKAFFDFVDHRLMKMAEDGGVTITSRAEFIATLADVVHEHHSRMARVLDIYYEKRRPRGAPADGSADTYRVYVMMHYPLSMDQEVLQGFAKAAAASKAADLRALAAILNR